MKNYLELIRIKHWIKNCLLFLPLFFSKTYQIKKVSEVFIGFIVFSFAASFIYIINDIKDLEKDRLHPYKKNRPLPSKKITIKSAIVLACFLLFFSILINVKLQFKSTFLILLYILLNLFYSFGLKNFPILDVLLLISGFIIRIYYGALIIDVEVSKWLFLTVFCTAMFLGFGKRKKEIEIHSSSKRKVLKEYNVDYLNNIMNVSVTLSIVFYSLWALEQSNTIIIYTIPIIIIIFLEYLYSYQKSNNDDPIICI